MTNSSPVRSAAEQRKIDRLFAKVQRQLREIDRLKVRYAKLRAEGRIGPIAFMEPAVTPASSPDVAADAAEGPIDEPPEDPKPSFDISSERHAHRNALITAQDYADEAQKAEADAFIVRVGRVFHAARMGWETAKLQTCPFCFSPLGNVSMPGEPDHMMDRKLFEDLGRWDYERYYGLDRK